MLDRFGAPLAGPDLGGEVDALRVEVGAAGCARAASRARDWGSCVRRPSRRGCGSLSAHQLARG